MNSSEIYGCKQNGHTHTHTHKLSTANPQVLNWYYFVPNEDSWQRRGTFKTEKVTKKGKAIGGQFYTWVPKTFRKMAPTRF